jgi:hypothetical protein
VPATRSWRRRNSAVARPLRGHSARNQSLCGPQRGVGSVGLDIGHVRVKVLRNHLVSWIKDWLAKKEALLAEHDDKIRAWLLEQNIPPSLMPDPSEPLWMLASMSNPARPEWAVLEDMGRTRDDLATDVDDARLALHGLHYAVGEFVEAPLGVVLRFIRELGPEGAGAEGE